MRAISHLDDPAHPAPVSAIEPTEAPEPNPRKVSLWLLFAALVPRALLMPLNENLYGDAVVRTELGFRWLAHPHWISSFGDGAFQFGPLHLYLIGLFGALWHDPVVAGRVVSLLFGTLTVLPLYALTRRLFGWKAGVAACLGFAVWGMHLQMSTTAGSEAVCFFLVAWMLALFAQGLEEGRFAPIAYSALVLNLACAVRYDCWAFVPLFVVLLFLQDKDKVAATTRAVFFGFFALPFPLVWMEGNERAYADPFKPIHYIEQFHQGWVADGVGRWGEWGYRAQNLVFWPATALATLSPLVALLGFIGVKVAWKRFPQHRWLVWTLLAPTAFFTFKAAVLLNFVPLSRFAVNQVGLLLPFVYLGFEAVTKEKAAWVQKGVAGLTALTAVALPVGLGVFTFQRDTPVANTLRPISPTSTNPVPLMQVARYLDQEVARKGGAAILDEEDRNYWDLQVAFFSRLPEMRLARYRWDTFQKRIAQAQPRTLVRVEGGKLEKDPAFQLTGDTVHFAGHAFRELPGFQAPWHVYQRVD